MQEGQFQVGASPPGLSPALVLLARARREGQILRVLDTAARELAGCGFATLISRDEDRPSPHPLMRMVSRPGDPAVEQAPPRIADYMRQGAPVVLVPPRGETGGLKLPAPAGRIALVPCSGADSLTALCAGWTDARSEVAAEALDILSALAATAGLALERLDTARRERMRSADLENRIRNVIAVIRSVSIRSIDRASSLEDFMLHYGGRLDALARPQIAMARSGASRTSFEMLLREELLAQAIQEGPNVSLQGMPVTLDRNEAEVLNLAIHELAVNALKFGALSDSGGALVVRWWLESAERGLVLRLEWRETAPVPLSSPPDRQGFGLDYLERGLPYELGARTEISFAASGLTCSLEVPLSGSNGGG